MAEVEIRGLYKRYGEQVVVDHLDLHVRDGEFVTLLGPSGCGKTSTLRAIAGLVEIDGGDILFDGRRMNDVPPHRRSAAMVFQSYALFPHMTVRDNIGYGLRMQRAKKQEVRDRVAEVMAMVGLDGMADRKPGQLSGGQQQRVALARAVVTRPNVLLFDEPLSNLDAKLRERLRIEIRELQSRLGITSIYVTHDQAEALVISDRIALMNEGRIEQIADPVTIYREPVSSFAAEFIGQANIVNASVVSIDPTGTDLDTAIGRLRALDHISSVGDQVVVAWRPEDMVLFVEGMRNRIRATVTSTVYMGNLTDVFLDANGQRLRLEWHGPVPWQRGATVDVVVPEGRVQILR